ncbi:hypothetical protein [Sphingomonas panni]|uniref:hypothetical protein n=1 Tax=Sphingomonas panni TaxID=237612 RepID=UPI001F5B5AF1|nr:hypothetical protein [Sphingomonas panni]
MYRADRVATMLGLLMLGSCGGGNDSPAGNAGAPTPVAAATPTATPAGTSSVPDRLTVTTNEPFYSVRIDGDVLTLSGVDLPTRRLPVVDHGVEANAREWKAQGGGTTLKLRVVRASCADDMSGAARDFAATLTMDRRTVRGCGYVGTPAPPPEEAAVAKNHIPAQFVGSWNRDAAACADPAASVEGVRVTPDELWFHESVGTVKRVEPLGPDHIRLIADYDGEGQQWTATQTLRISGDRLKIMTGDQPFSRIRCPK